MRDPLDCRVEQWNSCKDGVSHWQAEVIKEGWGLDAIIKRLKERHFGKDNLKILLNIFFSIFHRRSVHTLKVFSPKELTFSSLFLPLFSRPNLWACLLLKVPLCFMVVFLSSLLPIDVEPLFKDLLPEVSKFYRKQKTLGKHDVKSKLGIEKVLEEEN